MVARSIVFVASYRHNSSSSSHMVKLFGCLYIICRGSRFRSCDLWVMGPSRFLCATPRLKIDNLPQTRIERMTFRSSV